MALKNYKLLVGQVRGLQLDDDSSPHIEVLVHAAGVSHRIAINVRSSVAPNDLLFKRINGFSGPLVDKLEALEDEGLIDIRGDRTQLAIDYQKDDIFQRSDMRTVPYEASGPNNDLKEFLLPILQSAMDDGSRIFAFGEAWGPESTKDRYFRFAPGRGIHDIHMNQGSGGRFAGTNGPRQDGAILIRRPDGHWSALFLAFQSQSWGEKLVVPPGSLAIVCAMVNAINPEEGSETVTLVNRTDRAVSLGEWKIRDKKGRDEVLAAQSVGAGDAVRITLSGEHARLGNSGGKIQLISPENVLVDDIAYEKQSDPEGWSVVF